MNAASQEHVGLLSSDEGGSSDERCDSSSDEVRVHSQPGADMFAARAQVPTISVTAHSPGVLDDSLQQLRTLHAVVQRMRAAPLPLLGGSRVSSSCPSLCAAQEQDGHVLLGTDHGRKGSGESRQWGWEGRDEGRRSSWAALEPGRDRRPRSNLNGHSASLSSMESETEPRPARHSTHSLNDNELAKDFEKVSQCLRQPSPSLASRLPLQKSVSTPSIVAAVKIQQPTIAAFDHHAEKRRKRGSLFFRKKKDKSRSAGHCWQTAVGLNCDWCGRALHDKPALYCENCTMTVHQNVCKDYIVECNKPKSSKTSVGKSLSASSGKSSKRSSVSGQSQSNSKKPSGCYSPWRRVATKLGVHTSHLLSEDKDGSDHKHDPNNSTDESSGWWSTSQLDGSKLGADAARLGLASAEHDTWAQGNKALAKSLGERETKRQEHIYELILTEKHHCLTILLMQKMFADGMAGAGISASQIARMFPRVAELWTLHSSLLGRLRERQRTNARVNSIADVLADTFAGSCKGRYKAVYGEFCARHRDAVEVFKECCAREPKLARFVRKCQQNPLLRKKGVAECVLFVAQRLTKYPLLLEPLLKTAQDQMETELLQQALAGVKEILVDVDNQVASKEREDRKLEIYHRIDAKSFSYFRGRKFKKSDILQGNRQLIFEGSATLMSGRSKMQQLLVIVLSDVLFFLLDNNNKYAFYTPDNKAGVVSLSSVLVREKAGTDTKGLYLICSGPTEPEMFELRASRPKDIRVWIHAIRAAVQNCPEEIEESESGATAISAEERQKQLEARHENIRLITDDSPWWQIEEALRAKDREHATLLEEKMALHMKLVGHTGTSTLDLPNSGRPEFPGDLVFPEYVRLAAPTLDTHALWQEVCKVVKDALDCSGRAWGGGGALGRSTSSAGEKHSCAYQSPVLPRRADTFAGFDRYYVKVRKSVAGEHEEADISEGNEKSEANETTEAIEARPVYDTLGGDAAIALQHAVYTLTCIVWQQLTTIHSLEATVSAWRAGGTKPGHECQLEELRTAQQKLTSDRQRWEAQRTQHQADMANERRELAAMRQQLAEQQKDVEQQRERLYRRLERLQQHGSQEELSSVGTLSPESSVSDSTRRKDPKWRTPRASSGDPALPPQLLSANNETRVDTVMQLVKQQLPLKLASGKSSPASQPPPGYTRLHDSPSEPSQPVHHSRAGSSPATSTTIQNSNKATRTNTYPKLPDKFRLRPPAPSPAPAAPAAPTATHEEEVIYF